MAPLSLFALDAGIDAETFVLLWSFWTYPVTLGIAYIFRRSMPGLSLLPFLNVAGLFVSTLLHKVPQG